MEIRQPQTSKEWEKYFDLRYRILREPWGHPRGSERDAIEESSSHVAVYEWGILLGVGRLDRMSQVEGQIRYVAVEERYQGKGIGKVVMGELERKALEMSLKRIVLNARDSAIVFYQKCGYVILGKATPSKYPTVHHVKMGKIL